jgi:hypothetical protein
MNSTADQLSPHVSPVDCGDTSPLCHWETYLPVTKRGHARALQTATPLADEFYFERGLMVFTEAHHLRRGYCCGNGCRHRPFTETKEANR